MPKYEKKPRTKNAFQDRREKDRPYQLLHSGRFGGAWQITRPEGCEPRTIYRVSTSVRRRWVHTDYPSKEAAIAAADGKVLEEAA